jgi:hypothetical protein
MLEVKDRRVLRPQTLPLERLPYLSAEKIKSFKNICKF